MDHLDLELSISSSCLIGHQPSPASHSSPDRHDGIPARSYLAIQIDFLDGQSFSPAFRDSAFADWLDAKDAFPQTCGVPKLPLHLARPDQAETATRQLSLHARLAARELRQKNIFTC